MDCPSCGNTLEPGAFDLDTGMARCPSCGHIFEMWLEEAKTEPVGPPARTEIGIERRGTDDMTVVIPHGGNRWWVAATAAWFAAMVWSGTRLVFSDDKEALVGGAVILGIGFFALLLFLAHYFTRTTLVVTRHEFTVRKATFGLERVRRAPATSVARLRLLDHGEGPQQLVIDVAGREQRLDHALFPIRSLSRTELAWLFQELGSFMDEAGYCLGAARKR